ncbi:MAG: ribosomal protein S18-alanine N-acetyltransferase [Anaerovoracaceae bacterium]|jgi:ribosomal-protein-alanine N-acetyltransferase
MSSLDFRRAGVDDVDTLTEMDAACFSAPWSRESFREEMEENDIAVYTIAEMDGRPVAYMGLWIIADEGHITNVGVMPDMRRRHVADRLLSYVISEMTVWGLTGFTLEVRKSNAAARELYRKHGFEEVGLRPGYYEDNREDAIIMWLYTVKDEEK